MIITIPNYRAKSRNDTAYSHWTKYRNARDEIAGLMRAYVEKVEEIDPAYVTITAYYKGKRHVDTSNIDTKILLDALMHIGIIKDDDAYHNPEIKVRVVPESGKDEVTVEIIYLMF